MNIAKIEVFWSSIIGQIVGIGCSYLYNSRKTFKKRVGYWQKTIYVGYYVIAIYIVAIAIDYLIIIGVEPNIAWLLSVGTATIFNYIVVKLIIFK